MSGSTPPEAALPDGIGVRRVVVEVPATTANLGAGFDALALALDLKDRFEVDLLPGAGLEIEVEGEGAAPGEISRGPDDRFVQALETGLRWALGQLPAGLGWRVRMRNEIPLARGLGSSAAATVGGLVAADAFAGGRLNERRMLTLAVELEGHPDNVAAALLGGFAVTAMVEGRPETMRFDAPRDLRAVIFVPDLRLSTAAMRAVLPATVPHRDATFNVGRVALGRGRHGEWADRHAAGPHRGPAPRALSDGGLPGPARPHRRGPQRGRARCMPVGIRVVGHRLRRLGPRPCRGRIRRSWRRPPTRT